MIEMTNQQLADFQAALDWKTGMELPDGRILGVSGKRGKVTQGLDPRVGAVLDRFDPGGKTIVEFGACEGIHTVQLAGICKQVVGLEVRPRNIACALTRLFIHGVGNARLEMRDVRDIPESLGTFDIAFHVGVLYHLTDPVTHLARVAEIAPDLILDTHYASLELPWPSMSLCRAGRSYEGRRYQEFGWNEVFSGVEECSCWLLREDLLRLLGDVGYDQVEVLDDRRERNGPRFTVMARQTARRRGDAARLHRDSHAIRAAHDEAARLRRQLDELRHENGGLRAELSAVRQSWTWRVGRVAVGPMRRLRQLARRGFSSSE